MELRTRLVAVLLIAVAVGAPLAAADGYEISADDTTPAPERTTTIDGQEFTFESTVRTGPGDNVTGSVSAPGGRYGVYVYNSEEEIIVKEAADGDTSFSFSLAGYEPGTYAVAANDGDVRDVQPVLVSGYDVAVDPPETVARGESLDVPVTLTETAADGAPATVAVHVADENASRTVNATWIGDGEYRATFDTAGLEPGEYSVYGLAQGDGQLFDHPETLGLSDPVAITVENASTPTATPADDSLTTEGDGTPSTTAPDTDAGTTTEPPTTTAPSTPTVTPPTAREGGPSGDDEVLTPAEGTTDAPTTTAGSGPGFSAVGTLVALVAVTLLSRRRP